MAENLPPFTCGLAQHLLKITCPSSLAEASKQLLHDIRNPICYLLITSARLCSTPTPNRIDERPRSRRLQEIQGPLPSRSSALFVLMRAHKHLTQLKEMDVSPGRRCIVEQNVLCIALRASCFVSR